MGTVAKTVLLALSITVVTAGTYRLLCVPRAARPVSSVVGTPVQVQAAPAASAGAFDLIPPLPGGDRLVPVSDTFGYDPGLAAKVYGRNIRFVNLDPAEFPTDAEGDVRSRAALGHLLSHTTSDLSIPLWGRLLMEEQFGDLSAQLRDMGLLPSPYRYQLQGRARVTIHDLSLTGREQRALEVPYSVPLSQAVYRYADASDESRELGDDRYISFNCMLCHGGIYGDTVVAGAPNKNFNPEWLMRSQERAGALRFGALWKKSRDLARGGLSANHLLDARGVGRDGQALLAISDESANHVSNFTDYYTNVWRKIFSPQTNVTVGAQAATWIVFATGAAMVPGGPTMDDWVAPESVYNDKDSLFQRWLARYDDGDGRGPVFSLAQPRPWWLSRYSGHSFWYGSSLSGASETAADLAAFLAAPYHGNDHAPRWETRHEISLNIQTYINRLQSPPFPKAVDYALAGEGERVYGESCAGCHGRMERGGDAGAPYSEGTRLTLVYQKNKRIPLEKVGTDPLYWRQYAMGRDIALNMLSSPEAKAYSNYIATPVEDQPSMPAPPLVGLWTSAPYLHNNSVPTLWHVLKSADRPAVWTMDRDPYAYDYERVGAAHHEGPARVAETAGDAERELAALYTYDTRLARNGLGNGGHRYGDKLTDGERRAVIEFLKTLETGRVAPRPVEHDPHAPKPPHAEGPGDPPAP